MKAFIKISALGGIDTPYQNKWIEIWTVESIHFTYNTFKTNFDREGEGPGYFMIHDSIGGGWFLRKDFAEAYGFMEGPWSDIMFTPMMDD